MPGVLDVRDVVDDIISSYEERIKSIGLIFDNTNVILDEYHELVSNTKAERENLKVRLRDVLSKNDSLRKKDFDNMVGSIMSLQDERENEVRSLLNGYINEQREMARVLKENLGMFRDTLGKNNVQRVRNFREMLKKIIIEQDNRKNEIDAKLKAFQEEQSEISVSLKELLSMGRELRIKDLKLMLRRLETQSKERTAQARQRREEVQRMLDEFKKERFEWANDRKIAREQTAQELARLQ
ncbi:MAG: hypothetical protein PHI15_08390 [Methanomicrobium sp.]|nr:hypothetical protein [Methanomicrobium sp.]